MSGAERRTSEEDLEYTKQLEATTLVVIGDFLLRVKPGKQITCTETDSRDDLRIFPTYPGAVLRFSLLSSYT